MSVNIFLFQTEDDVCVRDKSLLSPDLIRGMKSGVFHGCLVRCSKKRRKEKLLKGFFPFVSNPLLDALLLDLLLFSLSSLLSSLCIFLFSPVYFSASFCFIRFLFSYCQFCSLLEHLVVEEVCSFLLLSCSLTSLLHVRIFMKDLLSFLLLISLSISWRLLHPSFSLFIHASLCTS